MERRNPGIPHSLDPRRPTCDGCARQGSFISSTMRVRRPRVIGYCGGGDKEEWRCAMKGHAFIVAAREAMANGFAEPRDRLQVSSQMLWKAMFYEETWPDGLRSRAAQLIARLLKHGPIAHTVDRLHDGEVETMLGSMREFVADFEREQSS